MNSGPASRTRSLVKRRSLSRLPDELLQIILEYASFDGIGLRLVCRRFDVILSSLLLTSIAIFSPIFFYKNECDYFSFRLKETWKHAVFRRMDAPFCPIDSHIQHITIRLNSSNYGFNGPRKIIVYESLPGRMVKHLPSLKSVKLIHNLSDIARNIDCSTEEVQEAVNKLITALKRIPANIHTEVELVALPTNLDARSVSLQPADWKNWKNTQFDQYQNEIRWPKNIKKVWSMIDSLDFGAEMKDDRFFTHGLGGLARESISNPHIFFLHNRMVPGKFLSLQFPKGFPLNLKKLHLRHPLIVNCIDVLHMLRNCEHLKSLYVFVIFNMKAHEGHGLPPGLEKLELLESGGTILPASYGGLKEFRYSFVGEPSLGDMDTVRNFIEHTSISHLELNAVSSDDLKEETQAPPGDFFLSNSGQDLLETAIFDQFGRCRISKSAAPPLREYIINLSSHPNCT